MALPELSFEKTVDEGEAIELRHESAERRCERDSIRATGDRNAKARATVTAAFVVLSRLRRCR